MVVFTSGIVDAQLFWVCSCWGWVRGGVWLLMPYVGGGGVNTLLGPEGSAGIWPGGVLAPCGGGWLPGVCGWAFWSALLSLVRRGCGGCGGWWGCCLRSA